MKLAWINSNVTNNDDDDEINCWGYKLVMLFYCNVVRIHKVMIFGIFNCYVGNTR